MTKMCVQRRILLIILFFTLTSCVTSKTNDVRSEITVTIAPLKYIVDKITGNNLNISVLVPSGASPETYEPTPQQIITLSNSKLIFSTGLIDFERHLGERLANNSGSTVIDLSEGIEAVEGSCGHDHAQHGIDPHIWTSPRLIKKMAHTTYEKLALLFPDSINSYSKNYLILKQRLDSLDRAISEKILTSRHHYFIIYHPALTYYANDYNIKQIALEQNGKEPSVKYMKQVISQAKQDNIKYIFYQSQFSRSTVESVALEIGAETVELDPLNEDIINNLNHITDLIVK